MRLCAYWDCMEKIDEETSFCPEHGKRLNRQLIDKCPKCGRYKDIRQKFCPDCTYGRPIADWKVVSRNLDRVIEYVDPANSVKMNDNSVRSSASNNEQPEFTRGEPMCPSCSSTNLTYKTAFDYYRCNDCDTTFITPVYSYGDSRNRTGETDSSRVRDHGNYTEARVEQSSVRREPPAVRREYTSAGREQPALKREQLRQEQASIRWTELEEQYSTKQAYPGNAPNLDINWRQNIEKRAMKIHGKSGKIGWVYLLVVICIVALVALIGWIFFNTQISEALKSIF